MHGISTIARAVPQLLLVVAALGGCSSEQLQGACRWERDCPDGHTCADGVCTQIVLPPDRGLQDTGALDRAPSTEAGRAEGGPAEGGTGDGGLCQPIHDGKLAREELMFFIPSSVAYTVGSKIAVDLAGSQVNGVKQWDLTAAADDDHVEQMKLDPVPAWAAGDFPKGAGVYASLLNKGLDSYGVFRVSEDELQLLGAISGEEKHGRATYADPVTLLRFPLAPGDSFASETSATGYWGIAMLYNVEKYSVAVLARGEVKLPKMLPIDALLVRQVAEQYPYGNPLLKQTSTVFLLMAACYGTLVRVVVEGNPGDELKIAAQKVKERWRLAPP